VAGGFNLHILLGLLNASLFKACPGGFSVIRPGPLS